MNFTGEPDEISMDIHASMHAAGDRWEVAQCESAGSGDWANLTDSGDIVSGYRFTCEATATNSFHHPAGIVLAETIVFVVEDGVVVAATSDGNAEELRLFNREFQLWLDAKYPDVAVTMRYTQFSGFPVPEDLATALEYVDEFVAESSRWGPSG